MAARVEQKGVRKARAVKTAGVVNMAVMLVVVDQAGAVMVEAARAVA